MSAWWLQYYTTLFQYTILYTHIHTYIDIIILHYYITLLQVYYITPLRHILYALSILPHNEYSLRTIFIHYSIISLYTSTVQRYTPYHNICFNALFHFLHFSSLPIYLFISNTHSSIPLCNNLSFINYTFIYAHKNSETKNQSAFATFHWSQKIIWIEICWQVMGARSPSKSGILSRVSSRGEEPDEYPDKQPVAWPARSISVQAQHPQPFFPSSQSASRFIPLWGNSSSFFFSPPLPSFVVERGFWLPRGRYLARPRWINLGDTEEGERLEEEKKIKIVGLFITLDGGKNGFLNRWFLFLSSFWFSPSDFEDIFFAKRLE